MLAYKQRLIRELKSLDECPKKILVAVSGGVDSVALLHLLHSVSKLFKFELIVAHVHHGFSKDKDLLEYRNRAQKFTKNLASDLNLPFVTNSPPLEELKSEAELRELRFRSLAEWQMSLGLQCIALGHHSEDLLETQMMRLMRGSSPLGLGAMSVLSSSFRLRPLLNFKKSEILEIAQGLGLKWIEDPSNLTQGPLRNRVRELFRQMDSILPGATRNLSLSLQRIVRLHQAFDHAMIQRSLTVRGIDREVFKNLSKPLKVHALTAYIRHKGVVSYTSGQLEELRKQLDRNQKSLTFKFMGLSWHVSKDLICTKDV